MMKRARTKMGRRAVGLLATGLATMLFFTGYLPQIKGADVPSGGEPEDSVQFGDESEFTEEAGQFLLREGSKLEMVLGKFQTVGGRVQFRPQDGKMRLTVLENLASERVSRALGETRTSRQWEVSGVITEYRDSNFFLVTRAVMRSGAADPDKGN